MDQEEDENLDAIRSAQIRDRGAQLFNDGGGPISLAEELGLCTECDGFHETAEHPHGEHSMKTDDQIGYSKDLGMSIFKSVSFVQGQTVVEKYQHCEICSGFHEVSVHSPVQTDSKKCE